MTKAKAIDTLSDKWRKTFISENYGDMICSYKLLEKAGDKRDEYFFDRFKNYIGGRKIFDTDDKQWKVFVGICSEFPSVNEYRSNSLGLPIRR